MSKAISLTKAQIKRTLRVCKLMPDSEVKRCALVLSHAAMRITEVARLKTRSVLYPSGEIKKEIHLPEKYLKSGLILG